MNKKTFLIISGSIITIVFLIVVYQLTNKPKKTYFSEVNKILSTDHVKWSPAKKNILVEYSDFQCSSCRAFHEFIKKEIESTQSGGFDITKKVTYVFRHFPLYQIHENAFELAYAAEAAGRQGKFFEMADLLFTEKKSPVELAKQLKLNIDQFNQDINSKEIKDKVEADLSSGEKADVAATPTFFLNGKKLEITSFEEFKSLLKKTP